MNSELPQKPESDRNDTIESVNTARESQDLKVELTSDELPDIWSDSDEPPIDVESESIDSNIEQPPAANDSPEPEAKPVADTTPESAEEEGVASEPIIPQSEFETETEFETESEPELFTDRWLDETEPPTVPISTAETEFTDIESSVEELEQRKVNLSQEIKNLEAQKQQIILQQARDVRETIGSMVEEGMKELKERKNALQIEIEKLERRRERINQEMRTTFAGSSQELAVRVQGFKDYLVGSLQDLAAAAERLELSRVETTKAQRERRPEPSRGMERGRESRRERGRDSRQKADAAYSTPQFAEQAFIEQTKRIRQLLDQYRTSPDYYGSPWQLRRTFEPIHSSKVQEWFFSQGGRGAIDSVGSRLQNILVASAIISILHNLYGDRFRVLVLIDTPEKLGEWRRGLQDCLGISRSDFGSNRGVVLFDSADVLVQRAERLVKDKLLPLIIIDETDELVNVSLLKFPLWLAFASAAKSAATNYLY